VLRSVIEDQFEREARVGHLLVFRRRSMGKKYGACRKERRSRIYPMTAGLPLTRTKGQRSWNTC
jgi:hypothetical protein